MDRQILRRTTQIAVFVIVLIGLGSNVAYLRNFDLGYFSWLCPFYYLQTTFVWASAGIGPWITLLVVVLGGVILTTFIFGRVFCSWICPFGTILDMAGVLKSKKEKTEFPEFLNDRMIKYGILIGFVVAAFVLARPVFCDVCPAGAFYRTTGPAADAGFSTFIFVPIVIMLAVLGMAVFYDTRAWCKYFCPLGAFLAIIDRIGISRNRVHLPSEKCIECFKCEKECPMGIKTVEDTIWGDKNDIQPGECIRCYACVDSCPMKDRNPMKLEEDPAI